MDLKPEIRRRFVSRSQAPQCVSEQDRFHFCQPADIKLPEAPVSRSGVHTLRGRGCVLINLLCRRRPHPLAPVSQKLIQKFNVLRAKCGESMVIDRHVAADPLERQLTLRAATPLQFSGVCDGW